MEKAIMRKWDWKTWAVFALGGAAVVAGAAFMMQSKHAALGRQVHRNVTKFLVDHGSQVHSGVISGGLVSAPMKINIAVNSTVVSMLNNYADMLDQNPSLVPGTSGSGSPDVRQEGQVSTGIGGVGGRMAPSSQPRPDASSTSPGKAPHAAAVAVRNPTETMKDEGGYGQQEGRTGNVQGIEYNPAEFTPMGPKPSGDVDLFAGDGIPSAAAAAASGGGNASGYE